MTIWPRKHKRKTPSQAFTRSKQIYRIGRGLKFYGTVHCGDVMSATLTWPYGPCSAVWPRPGHTGSPSCWPTRSAGPATHTTFLSLHLSHSLTGVVHNSPHLLVTASLTQSYWCRTQQPTQHARHSFSHIVLRIDWLLFFLRIWSINAQRVVWKFCEARYIYIFLSLWMCFNWHSID